MNWKNQELSFGSTSLSRKSSRNEKAGKLTKIYFSVRKLYELFRPSLLYLVTEFEIVEVQISKKNLT